MQIILSMGDKKEELTAPCSIFKGAMRLPFSKSGGTFTIAPPGRIEVKVGGRDRIFENVDKIEIKAAIYQ